MDDVSLSQKPYPRHVWQSTLFPFLTTCSGPQTEPTARDSSASRSERSGRARSTSSTRMPAQLTRWRCWRTGARSNGAAGPYYARLIPSAARNVAAYRYVAIVLPPRAEAPRCLVGLVHEPRCPRQVPHFVRDGMSDPGWMATGARPLIVSGFRGQLAHRHSYSLKYVLQGGFGQVVQPGPLMYVVSK
jgi:hypothetical protein